MSRRSANAALRAVLLGLALALTVSCGQGTSGEGASTGPPASASGVDVPVSKVVDGDTIHVTFEGRDERVRLIGVNTPEVDWYGGQAECYGQQAGLYTRSRLEGRTVRLGFDVGLRDR